MNWNTSSTLHWEGLAGRQVGGELSAGNRGGGGWWQDAEEAGERDMGSSSSSSALESSSEWLDSERHCKQEKKKWVRHQQHDSLVWLQKLDATLPLPLPLRSELQVRFLQFLMKESKPRDNWAAGSQRQSLIFHDWKSKMQIQIYFYFSVTGSLCCLFMLLTTFGLGPVGYSALEIFSTLYMQFETILIHIAGFCAHSQNCVP